MNFLPWLATAITSLGLLALVFGFSERKQIHKELAEQAAKLVTDIEIVTSTELGYERTALWASDFARLVSKSPPPLKTLTILCEHEQAVAGGHKNHVILPAWHLRVLRHFY